MNIKIIYTEESGRPPLYTTMANLPDQEKFFSKIIKEVVKVDGGTEKKVNIPKPIAPVVTHEPVNIITDTMLIRELGRRGKNEKSISKFLGLEEKVVKNVLESK